MFRSSRSPPERHVPRQIRLQRHVRLQPIPLERHVPRQVRLLRHVRLQPIPLERHVVRQVRLLRHVRLQPTPLERHVPRADPATATCWAPAGPARATCCPGRSGYCDMLGSSRPRQSDMSPGQIRLRRHVPIQPIPPERHVPRQIRLLRHVGLQPTPPERHVLPAGPATATCSPPTDPARATCCPGRSGYCDMLGSSRPRQSDMSPGQIRLLRHVRLQPIPLERHVPRADPATATCWAPADPARATCFPGRSGYCDMFASNRSR